MLKSTEFVPGISFPAVSRTRETSLVKSDWAIALLLTLVSALPTLILWNRGSYLTGDSYQYLRAALTFAQGQGLRDMSGNPFTVLTPFYPLVIGIVHRLLPGVDIETTARLVSFAGATTAVLSLFRLLRARYSLQLSFVAGLLFALLPLRVWSGFWALSEGLYLGLLMLGLAVLFRPARRFWFRTLIGGLLLGLAYLTRPEAVLYVAAVIALSPFTVNRDPKTGLKRGLVILAGFLLVALPYHAWVRGVTGTAASARLEILLSQSQAIYEGKPSRTLLLDQVRPDGSIVSQLGSEMSFGAVLKRYVFFARTEMGRLIYLLGPSWLVLALLISGGGLWLARKVGLEIRGSDVLDSWPFVLASWLLFLPFLHVEDRYLLPVLPAFLVWLLLIILAIHRLVEERLPQRSKPLVVVIPLALITAFVLSFSYRLATQIPLRDPSILARKMSGWLT